MIFYLPIIFTGGILVSIIKIKETIIARYKAQVKTNRAFIVGIDGLGGAGKTTFVKKLKERLREKEYPVVTIHLDDHIVKASNRYNTGNDEWYEYYFLQWDIDMLRLELFQKIRSGIQSLQLPFYNKTINTITIAQRNIPSSSIVLIEGVFIQRSEWREFFDFVIFLECPWSVRKERVLSRDMYIGDYESR